ncbi:DNA replication complex GINS protein PSF2 [Verticillium dahliae VDG1]|nr:DNA replication complex GINS protein PSF2 [Verticillium dahliae VDG1]
MKFTQVLVALAATRGALSAPVELESLAAVTQCPNTKIVLSGYSQGAQLVHNAAEQISAAVTARVTAVLTFGDPDRDEAFGSIPATRTRDAPAAATWVAARVQ